MLDEAGMSFEYERESFLWEDVIPNAKCEDCGGKAVCVRSYTPDFFLNNGVIIEAKGRFTVKDRKISLAMKKQGIHVVMLFQFDNKLSRKSKTRYSEWCTQHGIDYAIRELKEEWLT